LYDYVWIGVGRVGGAAESVAQKLLPCSAADKPDKLDELLTELKAGTKEQDGLTLVFTNTKADASWLENKLYRQRLPVAAIHGDLTQSQRESALNRFRNGRVSILIATDVASRGLDIPAVSTVINYDLPSDIDDYVHRIGRTGRVGRHGKAFSFVGISNSGRSTENMNMLKKIVETLEDVNQEVPAFLEGLVEKRKGGGKGHRFGGRDIRAGKFGAGGRDRRAGKGRGDRYGGGGGNRGGGGGGSRGAASAGNWR